MQLQKEALEKEETYERMVSAEKLVGTLEEENKQLKREMSEMRKELDKLRKEVRYAAHPVAGSCRLAQASSGSL